MAPRTILLVDDDQAIVRVLGRGLVAAGFGLETAGSGADALRQLEARHFDLLITDVSMPGMSGLELMQGALRGGHVGAAIMITGEGTITMAVQAMREGAADFITKPVRPDQVLESVRRVLGLTEPGEDPFASARRFRDEFAPQMIGEDPHLFEILTTLERVADTEVNLLISGPSGSGKELVAQAAHAASRRRAGPFVAVNCAAIPRELMESEIFGHSKGAFTGATERREGRFQAADGGTLFLDELAEMDLTLQGKFLRVLQDKEVTAVGESRSRKVDVRVVAATNQDLEARCREGRFREDLYFRLNVIPIVMPPLRERSGDIVPLAEHFLAKAARRYDRKVTGVDPGAAEVLKAYPWPGNVRELENLIERLVILKKGEGPLTRDDLPFGRSASQAGNSDAPVDLPPEGLDIRATLDALETRLTLDALRRAGGNKAKAAELLGLKRTTLVERLKRLGID